LRRIIQCQQFFTNRYASVTPRTSDSPRARAGLVDSKSIETKIVRVDTTVSGWTAETWSAALLPRDVRVSPGGPMQLRFVTHRHISPADVETTLQAFRDLWREAPGQPTVR
jgi:threonine aldolase